MVWLLGAALSAGSRHSVWIRIGDSKEVWRWLQAEAAAPALLEEYLIVA